jgi:hypothetical protein
MATGCIARLTRKIESVINGAPPLVSSTSPTEIIAPSNIIIGQSMLAWAWGAPLTGYEENSDVTICFSTKKYYKESRYSCKQTSRNAALFGIQG